MSNFEKLYKFLNYKHVSSTCDNHYKTFFSHHIGFCTPLILHRIMQECEKNSSSASKIDSDGQRH